ncbi:hypothetical protein TPA0906_65820 [Streptomyces olivaceus]|nr:hypothetical protein TPA0906_65820 [Streptomyces olivaceus]
MAIHTQAIPNYTQRIQCNGLPSSLRWVYVAGVRPNGAAMKAIREARGISLQQLAKDIGRDVGFLSKVERDQQGAGAETLHRYAERLAVPIAAITHKETPRDQERSGSPHRGGPDPAPDPARRSC